MVKAVTSRRIKKVLTPADIVGSSPQSDCRAGIAIDRPGKIARSQGERAIRAYIFAFSDQVGIG